MPRFNPLFNICVSLLMALPFTGDHKKPRAHLDHHHLENYEPVPTTNVGIIMTGAISGKAATSQRPQSTLTSGNVTTGE